MPSRKKYSSKITEADFLLANRKAAREEDLVSHGGRPTMFRSVKHKSMKTYNRQRDRKIVYDIL